MKEVIARKHIGLWNQPINATGIGEVVQADTGCWLVLSLPLTEKSAKSILERIAIGRATYTIDGDITDEMGK